jgi:hypothetical protein
VLLCLKTETELASKMSCFLKELDDEQFPQKDFFQLTSVVPFSLLDFLTLEDGANRFSQYISKELPLTECIISQKIGDLT